MYNLLHKTVGSSWFGPLSALIVVTLAAAVTTSRFADLSNLWNISLQVSILAIMAIGSSLVIYTGGIDLSPGAMVALITMVLAICLQTFNMTIGEAAVVCIALGGGLGAVNGVLSTYLRIPSFVATLATMGAFQGVAFLFNNGSPIFDLSNGLENLFYGKFLGIPLPFYYVLVFYVLAALALKYTMLGRKLYAVGGNATAARLSGIRVDRVRLAAFVIAGLTAGIAAVLMAARLNSGSPNYGEGMELQAIAAAVIGGASLMGGRGNIVATLFGALIIVVVQNVLDMHAVPTSVQDVVTGAIIVFAVFLDNWRVEISSILIAIFGRNRGPRMKVKL